MLVSNSRSRKPYLSNRRVVVGVQFLILTFLFFIAICYLIFHPHVESLIYPACIFLMVLFIWSLWSWKILTSSLFDPYVLFLIVAMLFNGGQAFLEVFHLNENGILNGRFSSETILKTLFLVILGMTSFHLGALIGATVESRSSGKNLLLGAGRLIARHIRIVGWGLLLFSCVPALLILKNAIRMVMSSGYFALFQKETVTGFEATPRILATFLVPGALFLLAGSKGRTNCILVSGVIILGYSIVQFFLGSRLAAVMPLVAYCWLWHRNIRPLPRIALVVAGVGILFFIFPLVRVIRSIAGEERLALSFVVSAFSSIDNPVLMIISEMGGSMMTVAHTLELVPLFRDFDLGVGYLYAFLTIIPNLFWKIHPTIAHGLAGHWLMQTFNPVGAALGYGCGFSFIAEAYLNFGWIGAPIILGIIGFLLARLVLWAQRKYEPAKMAMVASFLAFFLKYARSESVTIVRSLFWYALLPYVLVHFMAHLRKVRPKASSSVTRNET